MSAEDCLQEAQRGGVHQAQSALNKSRRMLVTVQDAMISGAMGWSDDEMDRQVQSGKSISEAVEHLESIEPQLKKLCDERAVKADDALRRLEKLQKVLEQATQAQLKYKR